MKKVLALLLTLSMMMSFTGCTVETNNSNDISSHQSVTSSKFAEESNIISSNSSSANEASNITKLDTPTSFSGELKVNFLDVGQGDAVFIELPNKETLLIDAGNAADGNSIIEFIKNKGYSTINYLIATHPHADHIGGMATVIQDLDIKTIYMPKATTTTKTYENLLTTIQSKGLKIKTAKAGVSIINSDNLKLDIIAPNSNSYENLNDYSAVLKLIYKEKSFLFMGDASNISENEITENIKADVLKVGHHGSKTSTSDTFLKNVNPKYAVISVGKGNTYGHPTDATLSRLNNSGIQIYRTDEVGTVIVSTDGSKITIDKKASTIKENAPPKTNSIKSENSSVSENSSNEIIESDNKISKTVYITKTGKKYHSDGCQYLSKSKIAISLDDAKLGYSPCSKCNPPQ